MAWYPGRRAQDRVESRPVPGPVQAEDELSPAVVDVLSVLGGSSVVLGRGDTVLLASPTAYAVGLVRGDRLASRELLGLVRRVRRDGDIRQQDLELPRGPLGSETLAVTARVAPLEGGRQVLVLVEDRSESRRVDAVRRDFVANVSHELKTPVGAMSLLAEALLDASDDPEAVRRFAGKMVHEASRLSNLVQELIDLSRLQGQDALAGASGVSLDDVVTEAVDWTSLAATAKDIAVVRGPESDVQIVGDQGQLVMAVRNLIDNAINYSPSGTRVAVAVREVAGIAELTVTDQGIGIPERDLERIFERFYRIDPARSRQTGGTGLGLSIVKHVAQNHGGEVRVWSVEGAGSTFTLRLPAGAADEPATATPYDHTTAEEAR